MLKPTTLEDGCRSWDNFTDLLIMWREPKMFKKNMTVSSLNMFDYSLWLWWWFVSWLIGTSALRCFGQEAFSSLFLGCQKLDGYRRTRQQSRYVSESDLSSRRRQDVNSTCVWTRTWTCFLFGSSVLSRQFLSQVEGQRSGGECKLCIDMPFLSLLALPLS